MSSFLQLTRQSNWDVDASRADWYSDGIHLEVQPGQIWLVSATFCSRARTASSNKTPGFYWSVRGAGPVTPMISVSGESGSMEQVFMSSASVWVSQSTNALFESSGSGPATFRVRIQESDLSGKGVLWGFSLVVRKLK